uniref:Uncharacterized protein n=1 Tax=Siphoviridae sp. cttOT32 TaxID=2826493 RepID=A0A8S5QMH2_9CAUD|nr:MAG TPA: hypothetical protein [Siphoviridae sp. cttOT32]
MACIRKLTTDIAYDCANLGGLGGIGEIDEAIIINSSDISTISESGGTGTITMITGTKGYVVNSVNNSVMYQEAIKANDTVPAAEDQSIIIKMLTGVPLISTSYRNVVTALLGGNFRVAFKDKSGVKYFLAGAFCGLEASDLATDSSTGGISTVTLKTPEAATGDRLLALDKAAYDGLKIPKA